MERFFFERDGVTLSGLRGGRGAGLVVLLHGLAGAAQEMIPTAEALADDYRVIALDLRGHGHSTRVPADLSRQAFVDDVLAVIDEPAVVVGQSMGAQTAMLVAAKAQRMAVDRLQAKPHRTAADHPHWTVEEAEQRVHGRPEVRDLRAGDLHKAETAQGNDPREAAAAESNQAESARGGDPCEAAAAESTRAETARDSESREAAAAESNQAGTAEGRQAGTLEGREARIPEGREVAGAKADSPRSREATVAGGGGLVRGLVMLEGGVGGSTDDYPTKLGDWFRSWPVPFADREAAIAYLDGTPTAHAWAADLEQRDDGFWPRFDPQVMETTIRAVADKACYPEWESITVPTLVVTGDRGFADPGELRQMRKLRPDVVHETIADAGHDAHLDQPQEWFRILRAFLGRL